MARHRGFRRCRAVSLPATTTHGAGQSLVHPRRPAAPIALCVQASPGCQALSAIEISSHHGAEQPLVNSAPPTRAMWGLTPLPRRGPPPTEVVATSSAGLLFQWHLQLNVPVHSTLPCFSPVPGASHVDTIPHGAGQPSAGTPWATTSSPLHHRHPPSDAAGLCHGAEFSGEVSRSMGPGYLRRFRDGLRHQDPAPDTHLLGTNPLTCTGFAAVPGSSSDRLLDRLLAPSWGQAALRAPNAGGLSFGAVAVQRCRAQLELAAVHWGSPGPGRLMAPCPGQRCQAFSSAAPASPRRRASPRCRVSLT